MKVTDDEIEQAIIEAEADDRLEDWAKNYEFAVYGPAYPGGKSAKDYVWRDEAHYSLKQIVAKDVGYTNRQDWSEDDWKTWYSSLRDKPLTDRASLEVARREPVTIVEVGGDVYIWDGHHRIAASLLYGLKDIHAVVGTPKDK